MAKKIKEKVAINLRRRAEDQLSTSGTEEIDAHLSIAAKRLLHELQVADAPEHLIHFNGDKFMGPYSEAQDTGK
jgi:hypothetical protein